MALNETSGSTAQNQVGTKHATYGSAVNLNRSGPQSPEFVGFDAANKAPKFNKGSFYSDVTMPTSLGMSSRNGTASLWFKITDTQMDDSAGFLFYGTSSLGDGFGTANELHMHIWKSGRLGMFITDSVSAKTPSGTGSFIDGQWHHVAFNWNRGERARLYADGEEVCSASHNANNFNFSNKILAGRPSYNAPDFIGDERIFGGNLDEIALFNRALTAEEIRDQYLAAVPEPSTAILTVLGLQGLLAFTWRRRRKH